MEQLMGKPFERQRKLSSQATIGRMILVATSRDRETGTSTKNCLTTWEDCLAGGISCSKPDNGVEVEIALHVRVPSAVDGIDNRPDQSQSDSLTVFTAVPSQGENLSHPAPRLLQPRSTSMFLPPISLLFP
jgi:hypothetical protein